MSLSRSDLLSRSVTALQQRVANRMAERIVDALKMIEIETMHGELVAAPADPAEQFVQALVEQYAIGQIGEGIVMRHVGDAGLGVLRSVTSTTATRMVCFLANESRRA